jgi:signal recognition particle subunit SRP72
LQHSDEQADILTNLEAAQKHLDFVNNGFLHALDALSPSLTKELENNAPPVNSSVIASGSQAQNREVEPKLVVKTVRKKRVPKGVVPGITPPDPERWMKKSERTSSFVHSGKRRKAGGGGGESTQGVVESVSAVPSQPGKVAGGEAKKKK